MKTTDFLKALPLLPASWLSSLIQQNKPLPQRQQRAEHWAKSLLKTLGYPLTVKGVENIPLDETIYFVSNHQGTLDPVLVLASCPVHVAFISKKENEKMPIFGRWARNIGTIHFDRNSREGNVHMLREAARCLKSNQNLLIFPEGTRSRGDRMNPFKEGSLLPAYLAKATIVPVTLENAYILDKNDDKSKQLGITYGKPIRFVEYGRKDKGIFAQELHELIQSRIETSPVER